MTDFMRPTGGLNVGTAPVPAPTPEQKLVREEPLADYKLRHAAAVPDAEEPGTLRALTPEELKTADREQLRRDLTFAQEDAKARPPPAEAVKIRQEASRAGVPFAAAMAAPDELLGPRPSGLRWADMAGVKPLSSLALDPERAPFLSEADARAFVALHGVREESLPTTGWGVGGERADLDRIYTKMMFSPDGVLDPAEEERRLLLERRQDRAPAPQSLLGQVGQAVVEQGPDFARMAAIGLPLSLAGGPVLAGAGLLVDNFYRSSGAMYRELVQAGVPHAVARMLAPLGGGIIAGLDTASFGALTKIPGLGAIKYKALSSATFRPALLRAMKDNWFKSLLKDVAKEGGTEGFQEVVAILDVYAAAELTDGPVKTPDLGQSAERIFTNTVVGGAVGGVFGGTATFTKHTLTQFSRATAGEGIINRLYSITENLPMRDLAPDVAAGVVKDIGKETGVQSVTVPAAKLLELYQAAAEKNPDAPPVMPDSVKRGLAEAQATGARVSIPLEDFVTHVRPLDTGMTLRQDMGVNDSMSAAEAKKLKPAIEKARKEIEALATAGDKYEPDAQILADIRGQLMAVGRTKEGAAQEAALVTSALTAIAKRAGKPVSEVYENAKLRIVSGTVRAGNTPVPGAAPAPAAAPEVDPALTAAVAAAEKSISEFTSMHTDLSAKLAAAERRVQTIAGALSKAEKRAEETMARVEDTVATRDVESAVQVREEARGRTERAVGKVQAAFDAATELRDQLRVSERIRTEGLSERQAAVKDAKAKIPTTLEQANPEGVVADVTSPMFTRYKHPESPLELTVYRDQDEAPAKYQGQGRKVLRVGQLNYGRDEQGNVIAESRESEIKYGGQGYSTALYVRAMMDAAAAGYDWMSDTTRSPATEGGRNLQGQDTAGMYSRLGRWGVPSELLPMAPERGEVGSDAYYITNEALKAVNFKEVWRRLTDRVELRKLMKDATEADLDNVVRVLGQIRDGDKIGVRGQISFDTNRNWFTVTLTGNANLSTFLHEAGHYLLEVMRKYEGESPEIAEDLRALETWAGVEQGQPWSVEALEKFARGFETYLMEGRAPSTKLARAFASFKAWMLKVYTSLTQLNAPLTDEVRGVMDRLVATQEEIDGRRLELGYFPMDGLELSSEWVERYRRTWTEAARLVQQRLDKEAIKGLKAEVSEEYKQARAQAKKDAARHPVVSLRSYLSGNGRTDGGLVPDVSGSTLKLDAEQVPSARLKAFTAPGGLDPDEVAPYFGFKNGVEMVEAMLATPSQATLESQLAKAKMAAKYPDYAAGPAWLEERALRALHEEEAVSNAIELELAAAHIKLGEPPPQSAAMVAKEAARNYILATTMANLGGISKYRNAETTMHAEAQKAFAAKDFRAAADATRKRLTARAMWLEMEQAQREAKQVQKMLLRLNDVKVLGRIGMSSMQEISPGVFLGPEIRDALRHLAEQTGLAEKTAASERLFGAYLKNIEASGAPVDIDTRFADLPIGEWGTLTVAEVMGLKDTIDNLQHIAREADVIRVFDERQSAEDVADQVEARLAKSGLSERLGDEGKAEEGVLGTLSKWRQEIELPENTVLDIDGGEIGTFHRLWVQSVKKGQYERDRRFKQRRADLNAIAKKHQPKGWSELMKRSFTFADGKQYTGKQVFAMLLNMGTENNRMKLVEGMVKEGRAGWSEESVTAFIHQVFPDAAPYQYAQAVLDYISSSSLWEDSSRVKEIVAGIRPVREIATPITLPDGSTIEGGYFPLVYDKNTTLTNVGMTTRDALKAMDEKAAFNLYAASGFSKSRTGYVAPLLLDPEVLAAHIYEVDHFISNAEGVIARHKLINHPRVKKALIRSIGFKRWDGLRRSNNYIAADGMTATAEVLQLRGTLDKMLFYNALVTMGGNFLSGLNQIVTGVPATLARLGPRAVPEFAKVLAEFARSPFKIWEEVDAISGETRGLEFHYDRDLRLVIRRQVGGSSWDAIRSNIATVAMAPVLIGQKMVNVLTFKTAFNLAVKDGKTTAEAVEFANSSVRLSQSSAAPGDLTAIQRSKDGVARVMTSLASYTFALNDLVMPRRLTQQQLVGHTARMVMLVTTATMSKMLFQLLFPKLAEKDEERESALEAKVRDDFGFGGAAAFGAGLDVVANVPLVGRLMQAGITGRTPRFTGLADTAVKTYEAAADLAVGNGLNKKQLKAVADAVGIVAGVPTRNILYAPGEFMWEYLNGNVDDAPWAMAQEIALVRAGQKGEK